MSKRQQRARWTALVIGLAGAGAALAIYLLGGLDWLERKTLDLRFQHVSAMAEHPDLACIDIDDTSLERIGRWPWPRDVQAGLLAILGELGARALLYDVTLVEPETVRSLAPRDADVTRDLPALLEAGATAALPDQEFRGVLADHGGVYLAVHYGSDTAVPPHEAQVRRQVRAWLDADPSRWQQSPAARFDSLCAALSGVDDQGLAQALRYVLGEQATLRGGFAPLSNVSAAAPTVTQLAPAYYLAARAARRCGFVVFEPDSDGVVRWMPLLVQHEGRVLPQLALAVGIDALGLRPEDLYAEPGRLVLPRTGGPPLVIPLDERGRTLVPWVPGRDWTRQFGPHVPAHALWQVYDRRLAIAHNQNLLLQRLQDALARGRLPELENYRADLHRRLELDSELRLARYAEDAAAADEIRGWMRQFDQVLADSAGPLRDALAAELARARAGNAAAAEAEAAEMLHALAADEQHRDEIARTLDLLRPRIAGKLCLVGYTATSLADMTPIPTHPRAPGVMAHANLLNGLLQGRLVRWAPAWLNVLIAGFCGVLASLVSAVLPPRLGGLCVAAVAAAVVLFAGVIAFQRFTYWVALTPALGAVLLSYFAVASYRFIFLDRERRQLTTVLSQYTSATLARKMAEDAELCRRAETREVSAMFTDLRNFTTISERIGAERTQRVLNICLGRCSEVMLAYEAMINKFIGDGIFAFWNPVIYAQPDHAVRACETALDLQAAMHALIAEQLAAGGDEAFGELVLRIGLASGPAVVGPCGSEQKYDYTCIGDTVNLAARLESANKFYGTRILVGGGTCTQVGTRFEFRPLGGVRVKGKHVPVPIFELLGRAGQVPEPVRQYASDFGAAVALFQERHWAAAAERFEICRQCRPDDLAAMRYLDAVGRVALEADLSEWSGALELAEK